MFASSVVIVLQLIVYYAMRGGGFKAVIDGFVKKTSNSAGAARTITA